MSWETAFICSQVWAVLTLIPTKKSHVATIGLIMSLFWGTVALAKWTVWND